MPRFRGPSPPWWCSVTYLFGHIWTFPVLLLLVLLYVLYALYYHIGFCICLYNGRSKACLGVVLAYLETLNYHW